MDLLLLFRFHVVPAARVWADAARRGPLVFAVAGFVAVFLVGLTATGKPVIVLPSAPLLAAALAAGVTAVLAGFFFRAEPPVTRWRVFFQARPRGRRALLIYLCARAAGAWLAAALVVLGLSGLGSLAGVVGGGLPFVGLCAALSLRRSTPKPLERALRLPWWGAWWLSQPLLFVVPLAAWSALMAWAVSGQAGFVWADKPPVAGLLLGFAWPAVFGLFWSEIGSRLPLSYFRLARAPFRRVLMVLGGPVAAATAAVGLLVAWWGGPTDGVKAVVLSATGAAFWFVVWLRSGAPTMAHFALFVTLFVAGAAAEREWWVLWALFQAGGAALVLLSWRTLYYEGETHAGN